MKRAFIKVPLKLLEFICKPSPTGERFSIDSKLPKDAKFIAAEYDLRANYLYLIFEHDSFKDSQEGWGYPALSDPMIRRYFNQECIEEI